MDKETPESSSSTEKRQMLLMGLVIGLLIGLVIALHAMDYFPAVSSFLFYLLIALFFFALVGILAYAWFKDRILQKIFGQNFKEEKAKEDFKQLYEEVAIKYIDQLLQHASTEKKKQAQLATPRMLKLGVWAFTRSWALRLLIAIFVAIGGLLGSILLYNQNQLLTKQNDKIDLQNNLLEADRRSSLVFLMSNILDKVDEEIGQQRKEIKENGGVITDSTKYSLTKPLINRIVGLSRGFQPYRRMQGNTLSDWVSPERGQLFIALMENNLDSTTQNTIVERGSFRQAIIGEVVIPFSKLSGAEFYGVNLGFADLHGADLSFADLHGADLREINFSFADLSFTDLSRANLSFADLSYTNLSFADLSEANLNNADLSDADLNQANLSRVNFSGAKFHLDSSHGMKNTSINHLKFVYSLYQCKNLDAQLKAQLEKEKPCLFTEDGCPEE